MATATLELINPYSKLGLKRRPTYDEIIGLINENETITGKLPDRTATFYKASPEGSFFDGSDALEILKEQQNRIMEREMRDLLMRRNVRMNGGTFNVERMQSSSSSSSSTAPVDRDRNILSAQVQADLAEIDRRMTERAQQTGEAQREELTRQSAMPTLERFLSGFTSPIRGSRPVPQIDLTKDDTEQAEEDFFPEELMTAREALDEERYPRIEREISYSTNIENWTEKQLEFQLFIRGLDVRDPRISSQRFFSGKSRREYYLILANSLIANGSWQTRINDQLLQSRISQFNDISRSPRDPRGSRD